MPFSSNPNDRFLRAACALCVALPALWMLRSQPVAMAAPMFTAALLALLVTAVAICGRAETGRGGASLNALDIGLAVLAVALLGQWHNGQLAFAAQALQPLAAIALLLLMTRSLRRLGPLQLAACAQGMAWGFVLAGGWNSVVGMLQFIELDGLLSCCMMVDLSGSVSGNFQQRNHLASYLVWAVLGAGWLAVHQRIGRRPALQLAGLYGLAIGLTGSRTGLLEIAALVVAAALWGWRARKNGKGAEQAAIGLRMAVIALALAFAAALLRPWLGEWLSLPQIGMIERSTGEAESLRAYMWRQVWQVAITHPLQGSGWDQLGFALLDSPNIPVPVEAVQNAHNLPLHLVAVLGWPFGLAVTLALCFYLISALVRVWRGAGLTVAFGAAGLFMIGMHSMVEYPLWYHHLLVPTALFAALAAPPARASTQPYEPPVARSARGVFWLPVLMAGVLTWAHALHDYVLVARAFSQDRGSSTEPIDAAYENCVWFEPPAAFAKSSVMPRDAANHDALHEVTSRLLKVTVQPSLLLSEIVWLEKTGDTARAERYARYLGSVFAIKGDAGAALDSAAVTFDRPELHRLADIAREAALRGRRYRQPT